MGTVLAKWVQNGDGSNLYSFSPSPRPSPISREREHNHVLSPWWERMEERGKRKLVRQINGYNWKRKWGRSYFQLTLSPTLSPPKGEGKEKLTEWSARIIIYTY
jgi:hypothetical protein